MKRDGEDFEGQEADLIYIAKRLNDATRLEAILTGAQVDYVVEATEFHSGVVFRRARVGAFFYVLPEARERAIAAMTGAGYTPFSPE